jgi:2-oxo-4-hydroxy-4-carboxy-5-ureidoimidazoline decarboxylase
VSRLDALPAREALAAFLACCGSRRWAEAMSAGRPHGDETALLAAAERAFDGLTRADWLEAFAHHPRIGDRAALAARFSPGSVAGGDPAARGGWAASEQASVASADEDVLDALLDGNREYEARFGHIFIVCATGKTAPEMLALLRARLPNPRDAELAIAAGEQRKITALRLRRLLAERA